MRLVGPEIQVFNPTDWSKGVIDKLRIEGCSTISLGPGANPHIAVFIAEKKGAPAIIRIYGLLNLAASSPTSQKTFYKADRVQIKWNALGTQVLILTQTEVDKTNKSYYGETGLYLLSAAGNFDCRVTLDKEGPISDFTWSPNSKEFGVVYGCMLLSAFGHHSPEMLIVVPLDMPAKAVLFDQRVRTLYDFGPGPINFISFNPQGRLILLAGFGNLAGKVDLYDRRSLTRVCTIDAPNTSWCEWSPDGKFLFTATLSPRLRVDNGIKIWHCTGPLIHIQMIDELYQVCRVPVKDHALTSFSFQASIQPILIDDCPPFTEGLPMAPEPSPEVKELASAKPIAAKPAGAYRPPGARGLAASSVYKREDEGGTPQRPGAGRSNGSGHGHGSSGGGGGGGGQRYVPGAASNGTGNDGRAARGRRGGGNHVPGAAPANGNGSAGAAGGGGSGGDGNKKKKKKKKKDAKDGDGGAAGDAADEVGGEGAATPMSPNPKSPTVVAAIDVHLSDSVPPTPAGESAPLDPIAKKIRNLNKKVIVEPRGFFFFPHLCTFVIDQSNRRS